MRKTISAVCTALGTTILALIALAAAAILIATALGRKPMAILSGSMASESNKGKYSVGGLIFVNTKAAPADVAVGDLLTFTLGEDTVVTHRVIAVEDGQWRTKGDANDSEDLSPVPFENMVGKAGFYIPKLGHALMNMRTKQGFAVGAITAAVLAALFLIPALLAPPKIKAEPTVEPLNDVPADPEPDAQREGDTRNEG
ncbi:MAG: signal peptidase I [Oscillospiraceae bacterium]|jgi:signal peptidase|nr:signal peptidase I [Oscillospiraceae bacterium]